MGCLNEVKEHGLENKTKCTFSFLRKTCIPNVKPDPIHGQVGLYEFSVYMNLDQILVQ